MVAQSAIQTQSKMVKETIEKATHERIFNQFVAGTSTNWSGVMGFLLSEQKLIADYRIGPSVKKSIETFRRDKANHIRGLVTVSQKISEQIVRDIDVLKPGDLKMRVQRMNDLNHLT